MRQVDQGTLLNLKTKDMFGHIHVSMLLKAAQYST